VHILASREQLDSLRRSFDSGLRELVVIHDIDDVEKKAGVKDYDTRFADGIFAWLCLAQLPLKGHYESGESRRRYRYSLYSTALYAASIAVLVLGLLLTESYISDAIQFNKASRLLVEQEEEYHGVYKKKFEAYEEVFANAGVMNSAVDLARQIERHGVVNPLDLYIEISRVIREARLDNVTIDAISWKSEQVSEVKGKPQPVITAPDMIAKYPLQHAAIIKGRIAVAGDDYTGSVDRISDIIEALKKNDRVVSAEPIVMPIEVRPDKKFAAESGISADRRSQTEGSFSVRVVMRSNSDV
jgi:hypothetical protein